MRATNLNYHARTVLDGLVHDLAGDGAESASWTQVGTPVVGHPLVVGAADGPRVHRRVIRGVEVEVTNPLVVLGDVDEVELSRRARVRAPFPTGLKLQFIPRGDDPVLVLGRRDLVVLVAACVGRDTVSDSVQVSVDTHPRTDDHRRD